MLARATASSSPNPRIPNPNPSASALFISMGRASPTLPRLLESYPLFRWPLAAGRSPLAARPPAAPATRLRRHDGPMARLFSGASTRAASRPKSWRPRAVQARGEERVRFTELYGVRPRRAEPLRRHAFNTCGLRILTLRHGRFPRAPAASANRPARRLTASSRVGGGRRRLTLNHSVLEALTPQCSARPPLDPGQGVEIRHRRRRTAADSLCRRAPLAPTRPPAQ